MTEATIVSFLLGLALGFVLTTLLLRAVKPRAPKHTHEWRVVSVAEYHSITGPRTVGSWKCRTCGKTDSDNRKGSWSVVDLNN